MHGRIGRYLLTLTVTILSVLGLAALGVQADCTCVCDDCYEDVIVTGAGTAAVNGTYVFSGFVGRYQKPRYTMGRYVIQNDNDYQPIQWKIEIPATQYYTYGSNGTIFYKIDASTANTPPASGWTVFRGAGPAPTLSGGTPCDPGCTAPTLSGAPPDAVDPGMEYSFIPTRANGCPPIAYSIANKPAWADFDGATGTLSGTPTCDDLGTYSGVVIRVDDANCNTSSLPAFSIAVEYEVDHCLPEVRDLAFSEATLADDVLVQEVVVTFSETMDTQVPPSITFSAGSFVSNGDGVWSTSNTVWTESFTLTDRNELHSEVSVGVVSAVDLAGNELGDGIPQTTFAIDTENPVVHSATIEFKQHATVSPFTDWYASPVEAVLAELSILFEPDERLGPGVVRFIPDIFGGPLDARAEYAVERAGLMYPAAFLDLDFADELVTPTSEDQVLMDITGFHDAAGNEVEFAPLVVFERPVPVTIHFSGMVECLVNGNWSEFAQGGLPPGDYEFRFDGAHNTSVTVGATPLEMTASILTLRDPLGNGVVGATARGVCNSENSVWPVAGATIASGQLFDLHEGACTALKYVMELNGTSITKGQNILVDSYFDFCATGSTSCNCVREDCYEDIVVRDAGIDVARGTYRFVRMMNNRPEYENQHGVKITYQAVRWRIVDSKYEYYVSRVSTSSLPPTDRWGFGPDGDLPMPRLTVGDPCPGSGLIMTSCSN